MMTINNKRERNDRGNCLGWPVTSYGPGYEVSSGHRIILCRLKETSSFVYNSANKVKIHLTALILFSGYVLVQTEARFLDSSV